MRGAVSPLRLLRPETLDGALRMMRDEGARPLAGCTDLYVALNEGTLEPATFIDLLGLDELRGIEVVNDGLRIGALATYTDVRRSGDVARVLPILAAAAREVGGIQIQNRGTIGGNIANASPAGDTLPVFAVAETVVVLRSADGERRVPFDAFYTGYRATVMRADEIITAVIVAPPAGRQWFRKVGTRAAQAISKVVMAGVRSEPPRLALGSVAATVVRARGAEQALAAGDLESARAALASEIAPIDDVRSTADYRRRVAGNLLARFRTDTAPDL
jgi:CO/xanthine dehydrogenase FAD-binding subunit